MLNLQLRTPNAQYLPRNTQTSLCPPSALNGQQKQHNHRHSRTTKQQHQLTASAAAESSSDSDYLDPSTSYSQPNTPEFESLLSNAERRIAEQQSAGLPPSYDYIKIKRIVETAMLAAVTGLAYVLATLLRLEGYLSYILPMPVVISALDGGPAAGLKTVTVTFLLLFILMGPVRALTYLTIYGLLSLSLGACWSKRLPWTLSVPISAFFRILGYGMYIGLSSWMTNENLVALMLTSIHSILDQLSGFLGTSGAPSMLAVSVTICSILIVNATFYVFMMHILYTIMLKGMGYSIGKTPKFLSKLINGGRADPAII